MNLGFTFYPKDWWASDSFYILAPFERYIYLELLFLMYSNDGFVANNRGMIEARLRTAIREDVWVKITDLFVKDGDKLTHESVNKRLRKTIANRENGKKGGRPQKPKKPKNETHKNPPLERESKREKENKEGNSENEKITPFENLSYSDYLKANEGKGNFDRQPNVPTKEKVWEFFQRAGGTKEMAKAFWDSNEATGWHYRGSPIVKFESLANKFIASWRDIEDKKPKPPPQQKTKGQSVQEILKERGLA